MWPWKKEENVDMTILQRIKKLEIRCTSLEADTLALATAQDIIRNKVLKKIQKPRVEENEEENEVYPDGLPR